MNEMVNNWWKELKQNYKYWVWHQKTKIHRFISKIRYKIQNWWIGVLESIEKWAHKRIDELWEKLFEDVDDDDVEPYEPIEEDTLG